MGIKDWYTVRDDGTDYVVSKMDPDTRSPQTSRNVNGTPNSYKVGKAKENAAVCNCYAGTKFCRHKKIVIAFNKLNRINSRWLYNIDKDKWLSPFTQES